MKLLLKKKVFYISFKNIKNRVEIVLTQNKSKTILPCEHNILQDIKLPSKKKKKMKPIKVSETQ